MSSPGRRALKAWPLRPAARLRHPEPRQRREHQDDVGVLMGRVSSAYTPDLYAGYVPNTGLGIGTRYMNYLRRSA